MNVGDYVRTKDGYIAKIEYIDEDTGGIDCDNSVMKMYGDEYSAIFSTEEVEELVIKSSPNIIDLIEVGDYVNGLLVIAYNEKNKCFICECCGMECGENWIYKNDDIKSIVTKEQFESMEYKVGDE